MSTVEIDTEEWEKLVKEITDLQPWMEKRFRGSCLGAAALGALIFTLEILGDHADLRMVGLGLIIGPLLYLLVTRGLLGRGRASTIRG